MPEENTKVFISYSRYDERLVNPIVKLLRANESLVFLDTDSIDGGNKWKNEIEEAIIESNLVVVFWCHHSHKSQEVEKEWKMAIELGKKVAPLLLDSTPLKSDLSNFQAIDMKELVGKKHRNSNNRVRRSIVAVFFSILILSITTFSLIRVDSQQIESPSQDGNTTEIGLDEKINAIFYKSHYELLFLIVAIVIITFFLIIKKRKLQSKEGLEKLVDKIEKVIISRTTSL